MSSQVFVYPTVLPANSYLAFLLQFVDTILIFISLSYRMKTGMTREKSDIVQFEHSPQAWHDRCD